MQSLILVVSLFALVVGAPRSSDVHLFDQQAAFDAAWTVFTAQYAKQYVNSAEELERKRIFSENLKTIEMHNYLYSNGLKSYKMGVNQFTDMTYAEFLNQKTGFRPGSPDDLKSGATYLPPALNFTLPNSVDWRQKGYVTPVKDQGSCGSCWAFSSTGSLEGQHFRKTQKLVSLSEQNLVDCSEEFGNQGCNGGWMAYAFQYIMQNGGIDTEECYPYKAMEGSCNYKEECVGATVSGFVQVPQSEQKLTQAIASEGPISVAIFVGRSFQHYNSGVYDDPDCGSQPNHAVLAVGYGTDNGDDYYIVKNSWAETWGEQGYIRMSRNKNNQCSIASYAIYPTV